MMKIIMIKKKIMINDHRLYAWHVSDGNNDDDNLNAGHVSEGSSHEGALD